MFNVFYLLEALSFCVSAHQTGTERASTTPSWVKEVKLCCAIDPSSIQSGPSSGQRMDYTELQ